jgi:hypothetical protein
MQPQLSAYPLGWAITYVVSGVRDYIGRRSAIEILTGVERRFGLQSRSANCGGGRSEVACLAEITRRYDFDTARARASSTRAFGLISGLLLWG